MLDNRATAEGTEDTRRQLRRSLECLVGVHFTEGNAITVLRNGDEIFPAMLEAIRKAQHTVDLMTFVYWKGRPAQQFADALCDRAKAGLRVRVLIDALGGIQIEDGIVEAMEDSGVDVHWYRKLWLNSPFKQNHLVIARYALSTKPSGSPVEWGLPRSGGATPGTRKSGGTRTSGWKGQRSTAWPRPSSKTGPRPGAPSTTSVTASLTSRNLVRQRFRSCAVRPASAGTTSARSGRAHPFLSAPDPVADRVLLTRLAPDRRAQGGCQPRGRRGHPAAGPERGQTRCATSQ